MQISKKATFVFPRKALRNGYDPKTSIGAQLKKTSSTTARRKLATEETNDQQIFSLLKHTEHLKANDSIMYPDFEQVISLSLLMSNNQCKRCEVLVQGKLGFPDQFFQVKMDLLTLIHEGYTKDLWAKKPFVSKNQHLSSEVISIKDKSSKDTRQEKKSSCPLVIEVLQESKFQGGEGEKEV